MTTCKCHMPDAWSIDYVRNHWRSIEAQSKNHTVFQSWSWIEAWLGIAKKHVRPVVFKNSENDKVIGICFIGFGTSYDARFLKFKTIFPFATGISDIDIVASEYNSVLCLDEYQDCVHKSLISFLLSNQKLHRYSRILLNRVPDTYLETYQKSASDHHATLDLFKTESSAAVNLKDLRDNQHQFDHDFSKSFSYAIRRSNKEYEKLYGILKFEWAENVTQAQNWLEELGKLNQIRFQQKKQKSAWDYPNLIQIHRAYLNRNFVSKNIEIVRLRAGNKIVGYLYNMIYNDVIYFYMSGIRYEKNNVCKPGLMIHSQAIAHHYDQGKHIYDFMAGDQNYKFRLGKNSLDMHHFTITKKSFKLTLSNIIRDLKNLVKK